MMFVPPAGAFRAIFLIRPDYLVKAALLSLIDLDFTVSALG